MKWTSIAVTLLIALSIALLPACGGSMSSTTTTTNTAPDPVTVAVDILGNRFDPQALTVPAGSTVVFHNTTSTDHGIECSGEFNVSLSPGQDYSYTFDSAGSFRADSTSHSSGVDLYVDITVE